jgi:hypothetical protein
MDYKPILPPGIHDITEPDLANHFLNDFPLSSTRTKLVDGLQSYISLLRGLSIYLEIWIDGSFTTTKPNPNDVDIVIFINKDEVNALDENLQKRLSILFDNHIIKTNYGIDVYVSDVNDPIFRAYWESWYGSDRNDNQKGIARIMVAA